MNPELDTPAGWTSTCYACHAVKHVHNASTTIACLVVVKRRSTTPSSKSKRSIKRIFAEGHRPAVRFHRRAIEKGTGEDQQVPACCALSRVLSQ